MTLKTAYISEDGVYRYTLTRTWDAHLASVLWVMLNPSTADASIDDPTIRRVLGFSTAWGFGSATVVNAFALRSTDPTALMVHADPIGPENDSVLRTEAERHDFAVCAWGSHGSLRNRHETVLGILREQKCLPMCLGTTKAGMPKHPLYLAAKTPLIAHPPWTQTSCTMSSFGH